MVFNTPVPRRNPGTAIPPSLGAFEGGRCSGSAIRRRGTTVDDLCAGAARGLLRIAGTHNVARAGRRIRTAGVPVFPSGGPGVAAR